MNIVSHNVLSIIYSIRLPSTIDKHTRSILLHERQCELKSYIIQKMDDANRCGTRLFGSNKTTWRPIRIFNDRWICKPSQYFKTAKTYHSFFGRISRSDSAGAACRGYNSQLVVFCVYARQLASVQSNSRFRIYKKIISRNNLHRTPLKLYLMVICILDKFIFASKRCFSLSLENQGII